MSVSVTPIEESSGKSPPPTLAVQTYMHGFSVVAGARQFFFPYRVIQSINLSKADSGYVLHIKTDTEKINLNSHVALDNEFQQICRHFS